MAQTINASPFYIKSAAIGFTGFDPEFRQAAALDGANRWQTFRFIMALVSDGIMTVARALGEFGATILNIAWNFQPYLFGPAFKNNYF